MGFYIRVALLCGIVLGFVSYVFFFSPPRSFPQQFLLSVRSGETAGDIAETLKADNAIRSEFVFKVLLRLSRSHNRIIAGTYYFDHPQNAFSIVWRLHIGNFNLEPVKVTLPEGTNVSQMNAIFKNSLPIFDSQTFLTLAKSKEGYLFPDTYFFYPGEDSKQIIETMEENFSARISNPAVQKVLSASGKSKADILIMASLIEKEAPDTVNRQIISGILWKRIKIGMPLQVDAVMPYITGKPGSEILQTDYKIDSPYNTYLYKGLPPGPITNPGIDAIIAAATPTTTPYLYYLSDEDGKFHYGKTFDEQLANQRKYLK
ncbi:hypothetical protein A2419_02025 [Candidatus Adlerbacteria bacterium RIFOXYC1_FULL_48_26]|uniref:Endolytic murein transglycosylase n=1 Tax=Candidatus Adlerbacteria bacterium RIFOXYC1_FULL_48_26 TaxID=1797247 RepID=A0A1F4Y3Q7_9BACT|nr:MAG: hypothetical protein A2419_02025 [Candidatus Adlerbacteria bacterium RIFOXYC1_FULL_48_26]OGC93813.1 MAG: hypothetical protein A2389_00145 [Candidatus Adlerbacteria bacterium RIFOXYB1_FULL_48_10]